MSTRKELLQKHTADMLAVERHILEAVDRQRKDDDLRAHAEANRIVIDIERTLQAHVASLEQLVEDLNVGAESVLKKAVTEVMGIAAGLYDKVRDHPVSRMLRDDYTALSLAAMSYTAYHTFGVAVNENRIATLAEQHLRDIVPLLVSLSKVLPHIVAQETAQEIEDFTVDPAVGRQAEETTHHAWSREVTESV